RDVFAIPANIYNPMGAGCNRLIQEGAKLIITVDDILDELNISHRNVQTKTQTEQIQPANGIEMEILKCLSTDPLHVDEIARLSSRSIAEVNATLVMLELKGL